jgi:3-(methylthio)propanoyl-CoA dehydrogenase
MPYQSPLNDMLFVMRELADLDQILDLPEWKDNDEETVTAILQEASRFTTEVLDPLNRVGDREGVKWKDGQVLTATGFKEAYQVYVENGWNRLGIIAKYGGQPMPSLVASAVHEMWKSANLAFSTCFLLTHGAIEALLLSGSDMLKDKYLPLMVEGRWSGTMNLTEPQAGSDLAAVRTKAVKQPDDTYLITGQKIFITYGEHDLTENIIHLVLARTPDGPPGIKGISLFLAPKILVNDDGSLGKRNDLRCLSCEHKLGIHASPTCVMSYGDQGGAVGYLVGEENRGIEYMFIMMNAARFSVGIEGLAIAERAYQQAVEYAKNRVQGSDIGGGKTPVTIVKHPDVRRMLMLMRSQIEAARSLAYVVAAARDRSVAHPDEEQRKRNQAFVDLMTPVVKGWSTEMGVEAASIGVQVHGGMGFIEETGAAQYLRDSRITPIYEGTTGIQANDLVGRKIVRENGVTIRVVIQMIGEFAAGLSKETGLLGELGKDLSRGCDQLQRATEYILQNFKADPHSTAVGAVPFLKLFGVVAGAWQLGRGAIAAKRLLDQGRDPEFHQAKLDTALFFSKHVLVSAVALADTVVDGGKAGMTLKEEAF